jgi:hypothetical protein
MSIAPPPSAPTSHSDPARVGTGAATPSRIGRLLAVVRRLIEYGQNLATTLQQNPSGPGFVRRASAFGTLDLAVIIARIACGLRRAVALEERLNQRAASGRDLTIASLRRRSATARKPHAPSSPQPREQVPMPTVEQIAAKVRRKPIGEVIIDICCDLGITPGDVSPALYREIFDAVVSYGGRFVHFFRDTMTRLRHGAELIRGGAEVAQWAPGSSTPALALSIQLPTGPP